MSVGAFVLSKYESDTGNIHPIRVQPETEFLDVGGTANGPPAGAVTPDVPTVRVSKGKREFGIGARTISIEFTVLPTGRGDYKQGGIIRLPILTPTLFNAIGVGSTGTYQGGSFIVKSKSSEDIT